MNIGGALGKNLAYSAENLRLQNLSGLESLAYIGKGITIAGNHGLKNLTGLNFPDSTNGYVLIVNNDELTSLSGMENVTAISGKLEISDNDQLQSFEGLDNLVSIGGDFQVGYHPYLSTDVLVIISAGNKSLTDFSHLEKLITVSGFLEIRGNTALKSLSGIDNVQTLGGPLYISSNASLSVCAVQSICDYLDIPNSNASIAHNAMGCGSPAEVEMACLVPIQEAHTGQVGLHVFPNPGSDRFTLEGLDGGQLTVLDQLGRIRLEMAFAGSEIDLSELPAGVYYLQIRSGDQWAVERVLKQ